MNKAALMTREAREREVEGFYAPDRGLVEAPEVVERDI